MKETNLITALLILIFQKENPPRSKSRKQPKAPLPPPKSLQNQEKEVPHIAGSTMIKCNESLRDVIREKLHEALVKAVQEAKDESIDNELNAYDPVQIAVSAESAMFAQWGKLTGPNKVKYRSTLFRKLLSGDVKPERVVNLSAEEMASDERQKQNQQIKDKAIFEC